MILHRDNNEFPINQTVIFLPVLYGKYRIGIFKPTMKQFRILLLIASI
jgi:hypothetical protein